MAQAAQETATKTAPKGPTQKLPDLPIGNVKAAIAAAGSNKQTLTLLPPDTISFYPGLQPRYDNAAYRARLSELVESMKEGGYMMSKPVTVWVGKNEAGENAIFVVDGHTRLAAAKDAIAAGAEIPFIPTIVLPSTTTMEQVIAMTVRENENPGQKLDPLEKALSIKRLMNRGMKEDDIMTVLGFGKKWFDQLLLLIDAPKFIREAIKNGRVTGTLAVEIIQEAFRKNAKKIEKNEAAGKKAAYEAAEKEIKEAIEAAGKQGRTKATRKDTPKGTRIGKKTTREDSGMEEEAGEAGEVKPRTVSEKSATVAMPENTEFKVAEWRAWTLLFGSDWYTLDEDRPGYATTTEFVQFDATFKHPKRAEAAPVAAEEAADEAETEGEEEAAEEETETEGAEL